MLQLKYFMISMTVIVFTLVVTLVLEKACFAAEEIVPEWALKAQLRERRDPGRAKFAELFKGNDGAYYGGEELAGIMECFLYGDVFRRGLLTDKQRELITLAVLTTNQNREDIRAHVKAALNIGVTPEEIKEAVYQCAPYIGFTKALEGAYAMNEAFREKNVKLPLVSRATVTEKDRYAKGFATQKSIFPAGLDGMYQSSPANRKHIAEYLASFCFGDFYTRGVLDVKMREILTLCILSALGGCESQVKSHVQANLNVGNGEDLMIEAITQCLPFIGFPRTLNALACVAEVVKK
ncbi:carboxymuconolactone decarboxylase family protein [Cloacibacillus sp.]|uniref:carboxymuconolactone decarboxylase family protein n=1 Tax=Cloacibacillus sp. TaxID=2049023 RepID=UPI0025BBFD11|nr:carboxymuconolactone decarboxylase family protein [Cloacibacillus sp.]MCC8057792.1 carboxymuconolactone decarboxylase family protein [Cloacibacillus sp.]